MKLDILAFGAHPDDVELGCSGAMILEIQRGRKAGIVDLTRGETGSRGTPEIREAEAQEAAEIIGCSIRENLGLPDGAITDDHASRIAVITAIRKYRPEIILCNAMHDRHPDHGAAAELLEAAWFLSGLIKIETMQEGKLQAPWRPKLVLHYLQDRWIQPDIVMDISSVWEQRQKSILAHRSQLFDPSSNEPETYIASRNFLDGIESRAREMGRFIQCAYAEGFTCVRPVGITTLDALV